MEKKMNTEKKTMEQPEIQFIAFEMKDVITTSDVGNDENGWTDIHWNDLQS